MPAAGGGSLPAHLSPEVSARVTPEPQVMAAVLKPIPAADHVEVVSRRRLQVKVGVPVVPGSEGLIETDAEALAIAHLIGLRHVQNGVIQTGRIVVLGLGRKRRG